jgi:hypothetical protein
MSSVRKFLPGRQWYGPPPAEPQRTLDHRREDQDRQRQEQTDPEELLKFRNHETVIVARMTRMSVMCLMATMSTMRIHVVLGMTMDARVV